MSTAARPAGPGSVRAPAPPGREPVPGLVVPVARAAHLVVLKLLARDEHRPQDAMDLRALRSVLAADDAAEIRHLAALVTSRGSHRERDLPALAEEYLSQPP